MATTLSLSLRRVKRRSHPFGRSRIAGQSRRSPRPAFGGTRDDKVILLFARGDIIKFMIYNSDFKPYSLTSTLISPESTGSVKSTVSSLVTGSATVGSSIICVSPLTSPSTESG